MKKCVNCEVHVGGDLKACPLCQNPLIGDGSSFNWPSAAKLKKQAFAYKLQLFIVLAFVAVGLGIDFLLEIDFSIMKHWSLVLAMWVIIGEIVVHGFIKKSIVIAKIISLSALYISLLVIITAWYYGFLRPTLYIVLPIVLSATLIANFVFALIDKTENAMVYLLGNILGGVIPYLVLLFSHRSRTLAWSICLMVSVVTFIGIVVFKGRKVWLEVQKRLSI